MLVRIAKSYLPCSARDNIEAANNNDTPRATESICSTNYGKEDGKWVS